MTVYSPSLDGGYGMNWSLISGPETATVKLGDGGVTGVGYKLVCCVVWSKSKRYPLVRGPFTVCVILSSYLIYGAPVGPGSGK
jgi:hypothetical protein